MIWQDAELMNEIIDFGSLCIFRVIGFYLFLSRLGLHSLDNCINVCLAESWKVAQIAAYILNTEK